MAQNGQLHAIQRSVWQARLPLEIRLAASECRSFDRADPYLIAFPRLSYLPLLLPRLHAFFYGSLIADPETVSPYAGYFTYDNVPLKWHLPLGLLYDIYVLSTQDAGHDHAASESLPFKLTLHFTPDETRLSMLDATPVVLHDSFINSVKEADFLRSGTAKPIMTLSAQESKALWTSTQEGDLTTFSKIHSSLVPAPGQSHISPTIVGAGQASPAALRGGSSSTGQPQTLGTALHQLIPSLFPSRRTPILATPLLHGAPTPMTANLDELLRWGCYADGWLSIVLAMRG
ncbi:Autophagy protein 5 [Rhinocladiella similis]